MTIDQLQKLKNDGIASYPIRKPSALKSIGSKDSFINASKDLVFQKKEVQKFIERQKKRKKLRELRTSQMQRSKNERVLANLKNLNNKVTQIFKKTRDGSNSRN
jgi:hypothetical protein